MRTFLICLGMAAIVTGAMYAGIRYIDEQDRLFWAGYSTKYHCAKTGEQREATTLIPVLDSKGRERAFIPQQVSQEQWKCDGDRWVWK